MLTDCLRQMGGVQTGRLLDLRDGRMGQTNVFNGPVDVSSLPACLIQCGFEVLADAAAGDTLFGKQNDRIATDFFNEIICKGKHLYELINVAG